jgi:magnesium chelatase family protein
VSLAHNGVLFLDEFPEFPRDVLESLRQPLEDGKVTIARSNMTLCFPSTLLLLAAMNPCMCGNLGDASHECRCTPAMIQRYLGKISGPLLDRIDLHIEVPAVPYRDLRDKNDGMSSSEMRAHVLRARALQQQRGFYNAHIPSRLMRQFCDLDEAGERALEMAVRRLGLSARAHDRILKVARTVADIAESETIAAKHIAEAVQYRSLDRNYWS